MRLTRLAVTTRRRRWLLALLILIAAPGLWWRTPLPPFDNRQEMKVTAMPLPQGCCHLGPMKLEAAWRLDSENDQFHGYSALVSMRQGQLTALSDRGYALTIRVDAPVPQLVRMQPSIGNDAVLKDNRDVEAATFDPVSQHLWIALEFRNGIARHRPDLSEIEKFVFPRQMAHWPKNTGPEAMVRLHDGRFIVLSESFTSGWAEQRMHPGLLFPGEPDEKVPAAEFRFAGPQGYRPTDMAALPDGRVLILMRRVVWPFPPRFAGKLVMADPAAIRSGQVWRGLEVGSFQRPMPVDNYEGLAIVPNSDGTVTVWVISDDNQAVTQATYLLRFRLDPKDLPKLP